MTDRTSELLLLNLLHTHVTTCGGVHTGPTQGVTINGW